MTEKAPTTVQPMDADAKQFLEAGCLWHRRKLKSAGVFFWVFLSLLWVSLALFVVGRGIPEWGQALSFVSGIGIMSFMLTLWAYSVRRTLKKDFAHLRLDLEGGVFECCTGQVRVATVQTRSAWGLAVVVGGHKIFTPIRLARTTLPDAPAEIRWFPNTRYCWSREGVCLWQQGQDIKWW